MRKLSKINLTPKNNKETIGRKAGSYEWYEIQDITAYYEDFEKEKIVWLELSDKSKFTIENKHFTLAGTFIMTGEYLRYLIAFLNSKLIEWYFDYICNSSGVGTNVWKKIFVEQMFSKFSSSFLSAISLSKLLFFIASSKRGL